MKKTLTSFLLMIMMFVIGCGQSTNTSDNDTNPDGKKTGSLTLYLEDTEMSKTILPDISMDIVAYDIEGNGPGSAHFIYLNQTQNLVTINYLAAGTWNFTVNGKNITSDVIGTGVVSVVILPAIANSTTVYIRPLVGQGVLDLGMTWPTDLLQVPVMTGTLTAKGSTTAVDLPYVTSASTATASYVGTHNTGYYLLINKLYNNGIVVWDSMDAVRIARERPSVKDWDIPAGSIRLDGTGNLGMSIVNQMDNPIVVEFSTMPANLIMGANMTIIASTSEGGIESYQWYIDAEPIAGANSDTIIYGSSLDPGVHRLYCVVEKGNVIGCNGFEFNVVGSISNDSSLSNLTVAPGTLTPAFASATTAYTVDVAATVMSIDVTPTVSESHASVSVNTVVIPSGTPRTVALVEGANTITLAVVAQDAVTTTNYVITVNKPVPVIKVYSDQPSYNLPIGGTITVDVMVDVNSSILVRGIQTGVRTVNGSVPSMLTVTSVVYKDAAHWFDWTTGSVMDAGGTILPDGMETLGLIWLGSGPLTGHSGRFVTLTITTSASAVSGSVAPINFIDFLVFDQDTNEVTGVKSILNAAVNIQ